MDFNGPSQDYSAQKELRKKRLEELKRKKQLKNEAMEQMSQGSGAVSAGPHTFAGSFGESLNSNYNDLPERPATVIEVPAALPVIRQERTERRQMPRAGETSFNTPLNEAGTTKMKPKYSLVSRTGAKIAGTTSTSTTKDKRIKRNREQQILLYLERGAWAFCLILCLRLLFADRGIVDYYSRKGLLNTRTSDYQAIHLENEELIEEIAMLKENSAYQKKIIRSNLGFIASDEFLILVE